MSVVHAPSSNLRRAAALVALLVPAVLIPCLMCAFAYDVKTGLGGLIAVFLLAGVPLALVAAWDARSWHRLTEGHDPSLVGSSATEPTASVAAGLVLLLFGAVFTVVEVGVGGDKNSDFAAWTSTAVGYLLLVALGAQTALLGLTWSMRRDSLARRY